MLSGLDGQQALELLLERLWRAGLLAAERGATPTQLAIAWALAQKGPHVVPVIGARTRTQLAESLGALDHPLSPQDVARVEGALPAAAGDRYDAHQMKMLDSDKSADARRSATQGAPPASRFAPGIAADATKSRWHDARIGGRVRPSAGARERANGVPR